MNTVIELKRLKEERDALEQRLFQAQKMEATGQLAGGIVHDFNNLLAVMVGQLDLVEEKLTGHPDILEQLRVCKQTAVQTASLTRGMLSFMRERTLYPVTFEMQEAVDGFIELFRHAFKGAIQFRISHPPGLWLCETDPAQMQNALLNLVINARDAMPRGGRITITMRNSHLEPEQLTGMPGARPGDYVVLSVSDTGTGMTPEICKRACEPFFTTKPATHGSGLGLSMVHGFAARSRGHIAIDSTLGRGTTVDVYLPRGLGPPVSLAANGIAKPDIRPPAANQDTGESDTMLVVDDNPDMRDWVVSLLRKQGYATLSANTATEALEVLRARPDIAVVFLDLILPGEFDAARLVDQVAEEMPQVKVVYMSGHSRQSIPNPIRLDPQTRLLEKPFGREELLSAIREARA